MRNVRHYCTPTSASLIPKRDVAYSLWSKRRPAGLSCGIKAFEEKAIPIYVEQPRFWPHGHRADPAVARPYGLRFRFHHAITTSGNMMSKPAPSDPSFSSPSSALAARSTCSRDLPGSMSRTGRPRRCPRRPARTSRRRSGRSLRRGRTPGARGRPPRSSASRA